MIIYVYYKIIPSAFPELAVHVRSIQSQLTTVFTSLTCDLLKRPQPDEEGRETWMEVYDLGALSQLNFLKRLSELVEQQGLPLPRRNESFVPI